MKHPQPGHRRPPAIRPPAIRLFSSLGIAVLAASIVGCPDPIRPDVDVAAVDVSAPATTFEVGATVQLTAIATSQAGDTLSGVGLGWTSGDESVATVSPAGLVTGVSPGSVGIEATDAATGVVGEVALTVIPAAVHSIALSPLSVSVIAGSTHPLEAVLMDVRSAVLTGRQIEWASSDIALATVDSAGVVTGVAAGGPVAITVTSEGVAAEAEVTVLPVPVAHVTVAPDSAAMLPGDTLRLTATATSSAGDTLTGRPIAWTSSDPSIATVDSTGLVTALSIGDAWIVASGGDASDSARVAVSAAPAPPIATIARIAVTPDSVTLTAIGATQGYTAVAYDTAGVAMTGVAFDWTSENPTVATVSPVGGETSAATAVDAGVTRIRASALGAIGEVTLRVAQVASTIDAAPDAATVSVGGYTTLTADVRDSNGASIDDAWPIWHSDSGVISIDSITGTVRGLALGTGRAWAALDGVASDTVQVTVSDVAAASLSFGARTFSVGRFASLSVPIYLSTAPTNAVTLVLTSSDPLTAGFDPTTLTFAPGQTEANAWLVGVNVGAVRIAAIDTAGTYGSDTVDARVQIVAAISFTGIAYVTTYQAAMHVGETYTGELRLSDPAPDGGLYFTIDGGGQITPEPATIHVPAGQLTASFDVRGVSPGLSHVRAQAPGTTAAEYSIQVLEAALLLNQVSGATGAFTIGRGQMTRPGFPDIMLSTPTRLAEPMDVTVDYADPAIAEGPGSVRLEASGAYGHSTGSVSLAFDGLSVGTTTVTASAPDWTTAVATIVVTTPMFDIGSVVGDSTSVHTTSGVQSLSATSTDSAGVPHPVIADETFRAWSSDSAIVRVLSPEHVMPAGEVAYWNLQIEPIGAGTAWLFTGGPGLLTDSVKIVVTAPQIVLAGGAETFPGGAGFSRRINVAIPPPTDTTPVVFRFESSDTMVAALDSTATYDWRGVNVPVRSRATGSATVVASAQGYAPDTVQVTVTPAEVSIWTVAPMVTFQESSVGAIVLAGGDYADAIDTTDFTFSVLDTTVVRMDSTVFRRLPGEQMTAALPLLAVGAGETQIVVTVPGAVPDTVAVTVTGAQLGLAAYRNVLGPNQSTDAATATSVSVVLPVVRGEPVVVHIARQHPELTTLSADSLVIPAGETSASFDWSTGSTLGADTLTFTAAGYAPAAMEVLVVEPRLIPHGFEPGDQRTTMPPADVTVALGVVGEGDPVGTTTVPVTVYVASTDPSVLAPDSAALHFQPGESHRSVPVRFVGPGTARLVFTDSAGVYAPDSTATTSVIAPTIQIMDSPTYYGYYTGELRLGMEQQNLAGTMIVMVPDVVTDEPLVITLASSDTTVAVVPQTVTIPVGANQVPLTVTARDTIGAIAIYGTADGLQQGRLDVDVLEPAIRFQTYGEIELPTDTTYRGYIQIWASTTAGDTHQPAHDLVLALTSSDTSVVMLDADTIVFPAGEGQLYVAVVRYVGPGTATITISDPRTGFVRYIDASQAVTVTAP